MSKPLSILLIPNTPIIEPVLLADAKDYLRVDYVDDDDIITYLITSSRIKCEKYLGLCLVTTQVKALYHNRGDMIELAYGPIQTDDDGLPVITGLGDNDQIKGFGNQVWVNSWSDELTLSYTSGFDTAPEWAKLAILKDVAWNYESRGDVNNDAKFVAQVNPEVAPETMEILKPYRTTLSEFLP